MLQAGFQFFIEVLCILQARYFKDSGNVLSLDGSVQFKFWHILVIVTIFSVAIKKVFEIKVV